MGTSFFPGYGISPSSEIGGRVLSGFHGFLERPFTELVNFGVVVGNVLDLEFGAVDSVFFYFHIFV